MFPARAHCKYVCTHKLKQHSSLSSAGSQYGEEKTHVYRYTLTHFYLMSDIKMSNHRLGGKGGGTGSRGCLTPPGRIPVQSDQYIVIDLNHVKRIIA